jgi:hypothetical protein
MASCASYERWLEGTRKVPGQVSQDQGMLPLPVPQAGGTIDAGRCVMNFSNDEWPLVEGGLVAALRPGKPFPILILNGEQGTAKSTTQRMLRDLIDPNKAALRSVPRDERDLVIAANNGWVIALDNLSGLRPWLSDALCRISTGGGFSTRALYENDEEMLFDSIRPIFLNGIEDFATRPDPLDRALLLICGELMREIDAPSPSCETILKDCNR